jgi:hypothetical protein
MKGYDIQVGRGRAYLREAVVGVDDEETSFTASTYEESRPKQSKIYFEFLGWAGLEKDRALTVTDDDEFAFEVRTTSGSGSTCVD